MLLNRICGHWESVLSIATSNLEKKKKKIMFLNVIKFEQIFICSYSILVVLAKLC